MGRGIEDTEVGRKGVETMGSRVKMPLDRGLSNCDRKLFTSLEIRASRGRMKKVGKERMKLTGEGKSF